MTITKTEAEGYLRWIEKQIQKYPKSESLKTLKRSLLNMKGNKNAV